MVVGDPVDPGVPAIRCPCYAASMRNGADFLLSDEAYGTAYRAKVIVFDVGSVHRFSTR